MIVWRERHTIAIATGVMTGHYYGCDLNQLADHVEARILDSPSRWGCPENQVTQTDRRHGVQNAAPASIGVRTSMTGIPPLCSI